MTQVVNFKRMEVTGVSKEEAFAQAPFAIAGDATQAYNRWLKEKAKKVHRGLYWPAEPSPV